MGAQHGGVLPFEGGIRQVVLHGLPVVPGLGEGLWGDNRRTQQPYQQKQPAENGGGSKIRNPAAQRCILVGQGGWQAHPGSGKTDHVL